MRPSEYVPTIQQHVEVFRATDQQVWDKILRYFRGEFFTNRTGDSESALLSTSVNLVFAITETALSTLIPPNPQVSALARNPQSEKAVKAAEAFVNLALDTADYRSELCLFVQDAVLYGRGGTKTTWDVARDLPCVRAFDPRSTFFDLTARRPADIRYWIESVLLSRAEMKQRVEARDYPAWVLEIEPTTRPKWLSPNSGSSTERERLRNYQHWYLVYEVYDLEADRVCHFLDGEDRKLFEDKLVYCPFDVLNLNHNGEDCRGLSEIGLISPNQEEVNNLLTYWLNIVRAAVPKGQYDPGAVDADQMAKAVQAPLGSWSPVKLTGDKTFAQAFHQLPAPQVPADALGLLDKVWGNITIVSALAEAQRGQVTGARTATELALIEGQLRNRLASRQRRIDVVTTKVAEKMLLLMQKYKTTAEVLNLTGQQGWERLSPATIDDVQAQFKVVPYSPMESNRAVVQEQFKQLLEFLGTHPLVNQEQLLRAAVDIFDNPAIRKYDIIAEAPPVPPVEPSAPAAPVAQGEPVLPVQVPMESPQALPSPQMQAIADAQASSAAMQSPAIVPPGMPPGLPQVTNVVA